MRLMSRLPFLWIAFSVSACSVVPPALPPEEVVALPTVWADSPAWPEPGQAEAASPSLATWWKAFGDPHLDALIDQALQANTSLLETSAALRQARAQRGVSAAGLWPSLGSSLSAQRSSPAGGRTSDQFQAGLDASWELDLFGGTRAGVAAAEADVLTAEATLDNARVSVLAEVALAYLDLRSSQERYAIAASNLRLQEETLDLTRWRVQAGLAAGLEEEQAQTAVAQTRARLPALEATTLQALNSLAVLTGQAPGTLRGLLDSPAPLPRTDTRLAVGLPAETLRQRPDVRAAEQRVRAALARHTQAQAEHAPTFRLGGTLGLSALTAGGLLAGGPVATTLLGSMALPLFSGGGTAAQVEVRDAAVEQARHAYIGVLWGALRDVENALVTVRTSGDMQESLSLAATTAASAADTALQRYASGLVDFQVVLDTQQSRLSAEDSLVSAQAQQAAGLVQLYKAVGGGWQSLPEQEEEAQP